MAKHNRYLLLIVIYFVIFSFIWGNLIVDVKAQDVKEAPSQLTMTSSLLYPVGERIIVNIELVNTNGNGLPNKPIILYVNGERVRRARTDDNGLVTINFNSDLPVGEYIMKAIFTGTEAYQESTATLRISIRPLELIIETLPPLSGIVFDVSGNLIETEADGMARFLVDSPGTYSAKILLPETELVEGETHTIIHFERWGDAVFMPEREIVVTGDTKVQAGLALYHLVEQQFVDLRGNEVDGDRIDSTTLKSSYGSIHTFEDSGPHLLQANRIARRLTGLEVTPVQYSVESVIIDGANVVNRYQQRFMLEPEDTWTIELLLYFARVSGKDAIFGFPIGEGITVKYPDEDVEELDFNEDKEIFIGPLARGSYTLQLTGVGGIAPPTPVALSRDQDVILKVLSVFDIGVGILLGALIGFGLLFYGRPELLYLPKKSIVFIRRFTNSNRKHVRLEKESGD